MRKDVETIDPVGYIHGRILDCELVFKCSHTWQALLPTANHRARFCPGCEKKVYFCTTPRQVEKAAAKKRCLAFCSGVGDPKTGEVTVTLGMFGNPGGEWVPYLGRG